MAIKVAKKHQVDYYNGLFVFPFRHFRTVINRRARHSPSKTLFTVCYTTFV